MIPVFITLGSNLSPEHNLLRAAGLLHAQLGVERASHVYESVPLGPEGEPLRQPPFLNAAILCRVHKDVPPDVLKFRVLRAIEASMGRMRSADKYAPRPIDLDIALYGDAVIDDPAQGIRLPDPEIIRRAYIALPLADLDPGYIHPEIGQTLAEIAARFAGAPGIRRIGLRLMER